MMGRDVALQTKIGETLAQLNMTMGVFVVDKGGNGANSLAAGKPEYVDVFGDAFYVTAAVGGRTWLTRGSLSGRTLTSIRADVECPSLSPDHTRIAFKRRGDLPAGHWRLAVYNLATGAETVLAETRSVDDQVAWLDDGHVIYGLEREGSASSDVWVVPADGTGAPRVLVPDASSPAVVAL
jgi:hypothetical protein